MDSLIALDIGTSGCRAAVCSSDGSIGPVVSRPFPPVPPGVRAEQNAEDILAESTLCVNEAVRLSGASPVLLVPSTILHSLVLFDAGLRIVAPMTIWSDARARDIAREMERRHEVEKWVERTGCISSASYPFYRVIHFQRSGEFQKLGVQKIGSMKALLLHRWAGTFAEDRTVASGSGLYNLLSDSWDPPLVELSGLSAESLPRIVSPKAMFAVQRGILPESITHIAAGSGDGALAHLGTAGRSPGIFSFTLGTSAAVRAGTRDPLSRAGRLLWSYALDDGFFLSGRAANNGGNAADHYLRQNTPEFAGNWAAVDRAVEKEKSAPLFAPFLIQERNESYLRDVRYGFADDAGSGAGSSARMRGMLEGIAFHAAALAEDVASFVHPSEFRLSGSLTRLKFVQRLLAVLLPADVRVLEDETAVLRGAAGIFLPAFAGPALLASGEIQGMDDAPVVRERFAVWKNRFIWDKR